MRNETSCRHLPNDRIVIPFVYVRSLCQNRNGISLVVASLIIIQSTNYILSWHPNSESHRVHGLIIKTRVLDWDAVRQPPYDRLQPTNIDWTKLDPFFVDPSYFNSPYFSNTKQYCYPACHDWRWPLCESTRFCLLILSLVDHATI